MNAHMNTHMNSMTHKTRFASDSNHDVNQTSFLKHPKSTAASDREFAVLRYQPDFIEH